MNNNSSSVAKLTNSGMSTLIRYLYIVTLCLSAFLLFLIQPMFTKLVLPLLGGAPAIWNTAMVFFQAMLLAGYIYAHFLSSTFTLRTQIIIHLVIMAVAILTLPIAISAGFDAPSKNWPTVWLLWLFAASIGLPFFIISANAPLLQDWFRSSGDDHAHDPYFLYAASNIGSIAALASYPLFIEVFFGLESQGWLWSYGFIALLIFIFFCSLSLKKKETKISAADAATKVSSKINNEDAPVLSTYAYWIILAFVPSALLLSVTNKITTDLLATPLLWVIPLGLYLLTFVIVFSRNPIIPHKFIAALAPYFLLAVAFIKVSTTQVDAVFFYVGGSLLSFFVISLYCHGRLASARPPAKYLTNFYIAMSFGGVLGGIFVGILAPTIFSNIYEYALLLILAALLMPRNTKAIISIINRRIGPRAESYYADIIFSLLIVGLVSLTRLIQSDDILALKLITTIVAALVLLLLIESVGRPVRLAFSTAICLFLSGQVSGISDNFVFQERSFFGVYTVRKTTLEDTDYQGPEKEIRTAKHGTTIHGTQFTGSLEPLSYYHSDTGLGLLFQSYQDTNKPLRQIGAIGLGTGTVVCYQRPGQNWTFFEIDPLVEKMARDPSMFTYMSECAGDTKVIIGDARLSLQGIDDKAYDLLIADAFSSDSIPIHLLTKEAIDLYRDKVKADGLIILHISNRYFDLEPIVAVTSKASGLHSRIYHYRRDEEAKSRRPYHFNSSWIALAREEKYLDQLIPLSSTTQKGKENHWRKLTLDSSHKIWTDDYSNVLSALK
ncbi:hypothetical protein A9Q97_02045 [Rhodospirillales bacterium 47_12_T64]|nr:hypothetical protein A9Q97_02045 [Rhodospirillales bacterium 47_12_T64]